MPNLKFATYLQGIDAFDSDWTNLTVVNNVVVTSACWGIGYASVHGGKIVNNTVLADGLLPLPGNCKPLLSIGEATHEGLPSNDVIVRNNIANGINVYNVNPDITLDHNICVTIDGKCPILTYPTASRIGASTSLANMVTTISSMGEARRRICQI